ncbi:restriction endonuclease subunit S [Gelatiniphilus marinus]|uniref:Restriction endonuclease subunit S n=1 Tax=Gelatiniphilus marinus TaxID=1759464 RepID=A0ABW5JSD5_9FLAO
MREGWICEELSNCIKLKSGNGLTAKKMVTGKFPVFGGNGIAGYHNTYNLEGKNIIIGRVGAQCGNARFIDEKIWLTDNAFKISEFIHDFDFQFLYYLLNHVDLRSYARQAAQPVISNSSLKKVKLCFPTSLTEQKQIVAILDKTFAAIDQAKANIEKNIANAKELFQSKLNDIFSHTSTGSGQAGNGWEEKTLGEVANVSYGFTDKSTSDGDYRYIRITDIDKNGELDESGKVYIKSSEKALEFILKDNDLLMARTGATFAKTLLYKDYEPSIFASYLIKISFTENISNELYWYFTKSGYYWEQANNLSSGSAQPHFNGAALKKVKFSYPTETKKQNDLIEIIKGFDISTKKIIFSYEQKLIKLEDLKKSILQKAFAGALTSPERTPSIKDGSIPSLLDTNK